MELEIWIYYTISITILTAIPGPSILLCVSQSVSKGLTHALYGAFGNMLAIIGIITLSFSGLGVIIASSDLIFNIIKYMGAIYLIYLGYKALTSKEESYHFQKEKCITKKEKFSSFSAGFIVGASNPKTTIFFVAFFPQFINPNSSLFSQYIIFMSTFAIIGFFWLMFYSYLGHKSSKWFLKEGRAKFFNRITGGVFVGAGVLLSTSNRT